MMNSNPIICLIVHIDQHQLYMSRGRSLVQLWTPKVPEFGVRCVKAGLQSFIVGRRCTILHKLYFLHCYHVNMIAPAQHNCISNCMIHILYNMYEYEMMIWFGFMKYLVCSNVWWLYCHINLIIYIPTSIYTLLCIRSLAGRHSWYSISV